MNANEKSEVPPGDPICPHCKREPCVLRGRGILIGNIPIMILCCDGCRKIISSVVLPLPPQMPQRPVEPEALILVPGREN